MKKVKYYYSEAVNVRKLPVYTDAEGNVICIADKPATDIKKIPRVTVATVYNETERTMTFGAAVCSPKDTFKKSVGRELALERATKNPEITVKIVKSNRTREISSRYAEQLIKEKLARYV